MSDLHEDEISLLAGLQHGVAPNYSARVLGLPIGWVDYLCAKWRREGIYKWPEGNPASLGWLVDNALTRTPQ